MYKEHRKLKVVEQSGYKYNPTPTIILKGQWLKEIGFNAGDKVSVECSQGKISIIKDCE